MFDTSGWDFVASILVVFVFALILYVRLTQTDKDQVKNND